MYCRMMMRLTVTGPSKFGMMLSRMEEGLCGVLVMHCASFYAATRKSFGVELVEL